jgi:hypothetical protein
MNAWMKRIGYAGLAMCLAGVLAGCPAPPKFAANGDYEGTMTSIVSKSPCPFSLQLWQELKLPYPLNHDVVGLVKFDLTCITDIALVFDLNEGPELTLPVIGQMSQETPGKLTLTVDSQSLQLPFSVAFECSGQGEDQDEDGQMDKYTGTYSLSLTVTTDVPGQEEIPIEFSSAFETYAI